MKLDVRIDRLVLDGFPLTPADARFVQAAAESELGRLLIEGGLASDLIAGAALPTTSTPSIHLSGDNNPAALGHQIARSVYGGIGR